MVLLCPCYYLPLRVQKLLIYNQLIQQLMLNLKIQLFHNNNYLFQNRASLFKIFFIASKLWLPT